MRTCVSLAVLLLLLAGCGDGGGQPIAAPSPRPAPTAQTASPTDPRSTVTPMPSAPLYRQGDLDPGLEDLVAQAAADLAGLLGVDPAEITALASVLVVWPDPSLGCPMPGMRYKQVPTDGAIIELEHDGSVYRYHAGGSRGPFLCPTPLTRAPSRAGGSPNAG